MYVQTRLFNCNNNTSFVLTLALSEQVTYQADHFLDKNKDYVVAEHQALLNDSNCSFVANLFPSLPEETSKQSKFSSIGARFKVGWIHAINSHVIISHLVFWFWSINHEHAATTAVVDGDPEHDRATLHQMCEAKHSSQTWDLWELQCLKPVEMWSKSPT